MHENIRLSIRLALATILVGSLLMPGLTIASSASHARIFPQTSTQTIVAIGDSIVFGLRDDEARGGWVGRLSDLLRSAFPNMTYHIVNAGVNGDTSSGVLARLDRNVVALQPNLVIVAIGTYDFDNNIPVATFRTNLRAIVLRLRQSTHAAILVQSFLPESHVSDATLRKEAAYNSVILATCRELHVGYLDVFNAFLALGRTVMANLRHDAEHPTAAGYRLMAAQTAAMIESSYTDNQGKLITTATPPGVDDLLPNNRLDL